MRVKAEDEIRPRKRSKTGATGKPSLAARGTDVTAGLITPSGRFTNLDAVKLRGGYYTPSNVAKWLASWAIRTPTDTVLEPSCGSGNLLIAAAERLSDLNATSHATSNQLQGVELSSIEANTARSRLTEVLGKVNPDIVQVGDFFGWWSNSQCSLPEYDVVIGNPPFIRYQAFPEPARSRAMLLMAKAGLKSNKLTNIWVPFVVAAIEALKPGGRLALVIPAELLQVTYAGQLRRYLTSSFEHVGIVSCNELFFEGAEQEVLLLLADGALGKQRPSNTCLVSFVEKETVADIVSSDPDQLLLGAEAKHVCGDSEKWLKYFLDNREIELMREIRSSEISRNLSHFAEVDVGVVTGKNQFFVLRQSEVQRLGLSNSVLPLVSRSAHLKGSIIDFTEWQKLSEADERVHLLNLSIDEQVLSQDEMNYVSWGEKEEFHLGYKCRIRSPWYKVPSPWIPDGFLLRQIYDFPRLISNECGATATDTIHRLSVNGCDKGELISSTYTYLTAASAEIEGRSYGGGVLELEPTEAERLLIPHCLTHSMPLAEVHQVVRTKGMDYLLEENSQRVLINGLGLSRREALMLKGIWTKMRDRRFGRGKSRPT